MEETKQKDSFFVRMATWIVDKRNLFFLIYCSNYFLPVFPQLGVCQSRHYRLSAGLYGDQAGSEPYGRRVYNSGNGQGNGCQYYV